MEKWYRNNQAPILAFGASFTGLILAVFWWSFYYANAWVVFSYFCFIVGLIAGAGGVIVSAIMAVTYFADYVEGVNNNNRKN